MRPDPIHPDRTRDIFEVLLAEIGEGEVEPAGRVLLNPGGYANPARVRQGLEPGSNIDPIAENVAVFDDDVALVDTDAKLDAAVRRRVGISAGDLPLNLDRATQRIDDAGEFNKKPVAGRLDQPAPMCGDRGVDNLGPDRFQPAEGSFLVNPDQTRIASDIGCQDRR